MYLVQHVPGTCGTCTFVIYISNIFGTYTSQVYNPEFRNAAKLTSPQRNGPECLAQTGEHAGLNLEVIYIVKPLDMYNNI